MNIKVGSVINCFAVDINISIEDPGTYVNGEYVGGPVNVITRKISIQELEGKDLRLLPEGARVEEHRKLYMNGQLPVSGLSLNNGLNRVKFQIGDEIYRLVGAPYWDGDYSIFIVIQEQNGDVFP